MLLTCRSLVQSLTELEEGALSPHDRLLAKLHLSLCSNCRRYRDQLLASRAALSALNADAQAAPSETFAAFEARMNARRAARKGKDHGDSSDRGSGPPS